MLELLDRAGVAHGHQREHHEQAPTVAEQSQQMMQPPPLADQHHEDREDPGIAACLPGVVLRIGALADGCRALRHRRGGHTQRRSEGLFNGRFFKYVCCELRRLVISDQRRLLIGLGLRLLALGPAQRLKLTRLRAGTALVHMDVSLVFFVLAPARAIPVQQPMHAELPVALAVVVQGLATERQGLGQARLVDPFLHQLHDQETTRGLVA